MYKQFKVNEKCIRCWLCKLMANNNFEYDENWIAFVIKQPETKEEENQSIEALENCPVVAIENI